MDDDEIIFDENTILPFYEPGYLGADFNPGIVGVSEGISVQRLYSAYMQGIFPWFSEDDGEPVFWYCPDPRFCIKMEEFHIPRSVERFLKKTPYTYTMDKDFLAVINGCRNMKREGEYGTWIGKKIIDSYCKMHRLGYAHSFEVWHDDRLVGGFYGVLIGSVFCGESMFTIESNSAKSAFVLFAKAFMECGGKLIDSQAYTDNIARYGAQEIMRDEFLYLENLYLNLPLLYDLKEKFMEIAAKCGKI